MKKKYFIINDGDVCYGPASKEEAELEAESMREAAIDEKLEEWGYDSDDYSEKRRMEAAVAVGDDGDLFDVVPEDKCKEYLDDYDEYDDEAYDDDE